MPCYSASVGSYRGQKDSAYNKLRLQRLKEYKFDFDDDLDTSEMSEKELTDRSYLSEV